MGLILGNFEYYRNFLNPKAREITELTQQTFKNINPKSLSFEKLNLQKFPAVKGS